MPGPDELKVGDRVRCRLHKFAGFPPLLGIVKRLEDFRKQVRVEWDDDEAHYSTSTLNLEKITVLDEIVMALDES